MRPIAPVQNIPHGMPRRFERATPVSRSDGVRGSSFASRCETRRRFGSHGTAGHIKFGILQRCCEASVPRPPGLRSAVKTSIRVKKQKSLDTFRKSPLARVLRKISFHASILASRACAVTLWCRLSERCKSHFCSKQADKKPAAFFSW